VSDDFTWFMVGTVVPDREEFHNPAFSRAGQMCQQNLLLGMKHAGAPASAVLAAQPVPAFPRARRIWLPGGRTTLPEGIEVTLLPCLNITPLKQVTIGLGVLWGILRWGWQNRRARRRIVFTYNLSVPPGAITWLAARLIGAKAVAMVYDIEIPCHTVPWSLRRWLDLWLHRRILPRFDGLIPISDAIAEDFARGCHYLRVEGGIQTDVLERTAGIAGKHRCDGGPLTVAFAGSLDEPNGVSVLLEAFAALPGHEYRLRIAGRGPLEAAVRNAAAADPRIEYLGFLSFPQVLELYRSADVLVNMRLTQTVNTKYFFPSKLLEYLASGVPVISTCPGRVAEEFGQMACLLHEETPQALAEAIRRMAALDPDARAEMGRRARQYMAAHKTWDAQALRIADYLHRKVLALPVRPETDAAARAA
jgi:glycosyltransferase involved in cell wall biosynthesis